VKKFAFRLEPLLKIRSEKTAEAKDMLGQAMQVRIAKERTIAEKKQYSLELQKKGVHETKISVQELAANFHHLRAVAEEIKQLEKEHAQVLEIESLRRGILSEAMKQEKVLDKLKEKKKEQFLKDVAHEENALLEDIAQRRVSR